MLTETKKILERAFFCWNNIREELRNANIMKLFLIEMRQYI